MQAWYKDGLLSPDLPVRREGDEEYILLAELRLQCADPTQPFGHSTPVTISPPTVRIDDGRPLPGIPEDSHGSFCTPLSDEPCIPSDIGISDGVHSPRRSL